MYDYVFLRYSAKTYFRAVNVQLEVELQEKRVHDEVRPTRIHECDAGNFIFNIVLETRNCYVTAKR